MLIKIFCIYHKITKIFKSDIIEPIQTGCNFTDIDLNILKDNTNDNIGHKNPHYGEMTAWYWVWKNYLKIHPELEYVGFCHYRRFFNFSNKQYKSDQGRIYYDTFHKIFKKHYTLKNIVPFLNADIILPENRNLKGTTLRESYDQYHPTKDMKKMIEITLKKYPQYSDIILNTLNGHCGYFCLNFIMKKSLFISFMEWIFPLLDELEKNCNWNEYKNYNSIRAPAFLVERFFNIWINIQKAEHQITISEIPLILLVKKPNLLKRLVRPFLFLVPSKKRKLLKKNWYN